MKRESDRLVLFTDAVVAIAITLLVPPLVEITSEPGSEPASELVGRPGQDDFTQFFYIGTIAVSSVLLTAITLLVHGSPEPAVEARGLSRPVVLRAVIPTAVLLLALVLSPFISYRGLLLLLVSPAVQRIR